MSLRLRKQWAEYVLPSKQSRGVNRTPFTCTQTLSYLSLPQHTDSRKLPGLPRHISPLTH